MRFDQRTNWSSKVPCVGKTVEDAVDFRISLLIDLDHVYAGYLWGKVVHHAYLRNPCYILFVLLWLFEAIIGY